VDGEWTPLEDAFEDYLGQLERARIEGLSEHRHLYPPELDLTEEEADELKRFAHERAEQVFELARVRRAGAGELTQLILDSAVAAMKWQTERRG